MKKNKKDRALYKYLSKFGEDYQKIIASKGRMNEDQVAAAIKKVREQVYGSEFYFSVIDVGGGIESACNEVFKGIETPDFSKPFGNDPDKTRLSNYLEHVIVEHRDIAKKIGAKPIDLSHFENSVREIYAFQIYLIAKTHSKSPSEVFEFLYGPNGIGRVYVHSEKNIDSKSDDNNDGAK